MARLLEARRQGSRSSTKRRSRLCELWAESRRRGRDAKPRDVDRIMGFGFNWAPPGGARRRVRRAADDRRARAGEAAGPRGARRDTPARASGCSASPTSTSGASSSASLRIDRSDPWQTRRLRPRRLPDRLRAQLDEGRQAHLRDDPRGGRPAGSRRPAIEPKEVEVGHVGNFAAELYAMQGHLGAFLVDVDPAFSGLPTVAARGRLRLRLDRAPRRLRRDRGRPLRPGDGRRRRADEDRRPEAGRRLPRHGRLVRDRGEGRRVPVPEAVRPARRRVRQALRPEGRAPRAHLRGQLRATPSGTRSRRRAPGT